MTAVRDALVFGLLRNPVLNREVRERLRERRSIINITLALAVLSVILYLTYRSVVGNNEVDLVQSAGVGRIMFEVVLLVLLAVVAFGAPGASADAITGERERQTLLPLQVTLLSPLAILVGKVAAAVAFIVLIAVLSLPLFGVAYLYGGVGVGEIIRGVVAIGATGVVISSLSVAASTVARRTQGAVLMSYFLTAALFIGTWVVYGFQAALRAQNGDGRPTPTVLVFNPLVGLASAIDTGSESTDGPLSSLQQMLRDAERPEAAFVAVPAEIGPNDGPLAGDVQQMQRLEPPEASGLARIPLWIRSGAALGFVAGLALLLAARRLRTPSARLRE